MHSKATYPLRVHQITTQQVGKGSKLINRRNEFFTHHTKSNHEYAQTCLFEGNLLPVHQFTAQVGKGDKRGINFHTSHKIQS